MLKNKDQEPLNGFKILAVKTLPKCDKRFLKILKRNTFYYFFNNYKIDPITEAISSEDSCAGGIHNSGEKQINVSAIVGKNGSGKSAIIELIFRAINNFSSKQNFPKVKFQSLDTLHLAIYYHTDKYHKLEVRGTDVFLYSYNKDLTLSKKFQTNPKIPDFFYTVAVNYSHYAYNSLDYEEGPWIESFFLKNDGYQTPIVINPFRDEGSIMINTENDLLQSRLLANLVTPNGSNRSALRRVSENLEAYKITLTLRKSKAHSPLWTVEVEGEDPLQYFISIVDHQREDILRKLNKLYPFNYSSLSEYHGIALDYIIYKLIRICLNYPQYNHYFSTRKKKFEESTLDDFLRNVITDSSHITFKLKQTLNFLLIQDTKLENQSLTLDQLEEKHVEARKGRSKTKLKTIEMLPPPLFKTEVIMRRTDDPNQDDISIKALSSGEKQMLYSVNSLVYHLINLNSVPEGRGIRKYKYVNIILEEIELYFHPEMQRTYLNAILEKVATLEMKGILSINLCFVTHSPFILSDIPTTNILFLEDDGRPAAKAIEFRTFGANIHDLLKQSFFLREGSMGEFARRTIKDTISYLQYCQLLNEQQQLLGDIKSGRVKKSDDFMKLKAEEVEDAKKAVVEFDGNYHRRIIEIIDEPILKLKLMQLYDESHSDELELRLIEEKMTALKKQAAKIKKRK